MNADAIINIQGLRKRFGDLEVLKGIDLTVRRAEVVAIIGRSGSGKSTLLRCINGLEPFQEGTLSVEQQALRPGDEQALRALRQRVGMIFQGFHLFPHLNAGRNVMLAPGLVKACAARPASSVRANCWPAWVWRRSSTPLQISSPAGSSNAWPSRARWRWTRPCCCATRSPRRWTRNSSARC